MATGPINTLSAEQELAQERRLHFFTRKELAAYQEDEAKMLAKVKFLQERVQQLEAREESVAHFLRNF